MPVPIHKWVPSRPFDTEYLDPERPAPTYAGVKPGGLLLSAEDHDDQEAAGADDPEQS